MSADPKENLVKHGIRAAQLGLAVNNALVLIKLVSGVLGNS